MDVRVLNQEIGDGWAAYHGDVCDVIKGIPTGSVGLTVTSFPFQSLYTYSATPRDVGNVRSVEEFQAHLDYLVPELLRVTMPGRNISLHCMLLPVSKQMAGYIGLSDFRGDLIRLFQKHGWIFHSEVCIWKDPVTAMQRTKALGLLWKQLKKDSSMSRQGIADYMVTMRAPGENPEPIAHTPADFPVKDWQKMASPVWMDIDPSDTLQFRSAREDKDERHICPLQLEPVRRCVRLWSNPGDVVFDPFGGIGSVPYVARQMGRRGLMTELKESYWRQAVGNLRAAARGDRQLSMFPEAPAPAQAEPEETDEDLGGVDAGAAEVAAGEVG
jgi:hypothetical protein